MSFSRPIQWYQSGRTVPLTLVFLTVLGNSVVILTVLIRKNIQTTRNIFIFYLAISGNSLLTQVS